MMTDGITLWWAAAAFLAFFVKGLSGFANTLVFNSVLSFTTVNIQISPVELVLGYPSNIIIAIRERKNIRRDIVVPLVSAVTAGSLAGVFLLKHLDARFVRLFFGALVVFIGIGMLTRKQHPTQKAGSRGVMLGLGLLSGVFCGLYGVGALLAAYVSRYVSDSGSFKGCLCAVFVAENTFRLVLYGVTGILTPERAMAALSLMPFMLAGLLLGIFCSRIIKEKAIRKIIIWLLILSGAMLIIMSL